MSFNTSLFFLIVALSSFALCQKDAEKKNGPPNGGGHFLFGPSYLKNLTKEEKQEYYKIFGNQQLTIKQQEEQRLAFAEKHGFAQAIKDDMKLKADNQEIVKKQRPEVIKSLLEVHNELIKIFDNKDQTVAQQEAAVSALRKKYPNGPAVLYYISRLITGHDRHQHPRRRKN
ncbi:Protein CBG06007 [Caenorhabditis briggsae]|uniref:SXP/RAL-2 family protein Ani s 5-like cation-binding domain-containing protein n=2 Tax=Caenorhabditis briggsae TaxID=6238 RepID=A0AAE9AB28_CAEBR|nr:Protein CBG06007 [Caenorhabditis briggsae]ULT95313.1 hypothetical protein L3Y34_004202 [Caenorhabditis briggsae]UMM28514.1 hypothetical protein L5515_011321 [Caenorhabditis briggsae]CAP26355.1 Protein CBG06007 [Caenorhabditis briggsae]